MSALRNAILVREAKAAGADDFIDKPIKTLGLHSAKIQLHPEVLVAVSVNVARSQEEADRQARGENVTVIKDEKLDIETYSEDMFEEGSAPADEAEEA